MLKAVFSSSLVQNVLAWVIVQYLRFVWMTSKVTIEPANAHDLVSQQFPVILAMWHGQHLMTPFVQKAGYRSKVLISRHRDGELNAKVVSYFGIGLVRGSGAHDGRVMEKRGAVALMQMLRELEAGWNMALTADVPKIARKAGRGIVMLARVSGRPIFPVAIASSRRKIFERSWDKTALNLPFSRIAFVLGAPVYVAADVDEAGAEAARLQVEDSMNAATCKAYEIVDGHRLGTH